VPEESTHAQHQNKSRLAYRIAVDYAGFKTPALEISYCIYNYKRLLQVIKEKCLRDFI
jgi:hypothetical protein